jgi:hypothetical protein
MDLTRRFRSLLADPRRELASVVTVMALVLVVLSVHVLCSVHLDERAPDAGTAQAAVVQHRGHDGVSPRAAAEVTLGPLDGHAHGCTDHGPVTAQWDPVRPLPQGPAVVPVLAVQWPLPDLGPREPRVSQGVAAVAAPSLHALGISRT